METDPVLPTLAALIAARRKALGLTNDEQLAKLTGRYQTTVSGWRRGTGWPTPDLFEVVANWLDITPDELAQIIVAEHVTNGRRIRRPRDHVVAVPGTGGVAEVAARLERLAERVSSLEQQLAALTPPPAPSTDRKSRKS